MSTEIWISILGALTAIIVSTIGAYLANRNSVILQIRKLKEEHYTSFIELLHIHAANDTEESLRNFVLARDKMLLIASEKVIKKMIEYENKGVGKPFETHNIYLTELIKSIRMDLKLKDKDFPIINFKKANKNTVVDVIKPGRRTEKNPKKLATNDGYNSPAHQNVPLGKGRNKSINQRLDLIQKNPSDFPTTKS